MDNPLVSILIITYNQAHFIRETIDSCLSQSYTNLEIVIADDGSSDETQDILSEYQKKHPSKIKLSLSQANRGITENSNLGLRLCTGKYIAFLGGDDLMMPDKIKKQVAFMESNPQCNICYHKLEVFDSKTGDKISVRNVAKRPLKFIDALALGTINGGSSTLVRASATPPYGFRTTLSVASDWMYWLDTLKAGGLMIGLPEILGKYRRHDSNVTSRDNPRVRQNIIDTLNTCNIVMIENPEYRRVAIRKFAAVFLFFRKSDGYFSTLVYSLRFAFRVRVFLALLLFLMTFGLVRL